MIAGKKIVIVGGASGIGYALACKAADAGAKVVIASRSSEKLREAQTQSNNRFGTDTVDASDDASVEQFFGRIGTFDHLVCTIKPRLPANDFLEEDIDEARQAFDAKFWGQYRLARYAAPRIDRGGSILLTSGIASSRSYKGYAIVSAMNAAVEALAKAVAGELAPVRINVVCPGFIDTVPPNETRVQHVRRIAAPFPLDRLGTPSEVAEAYLYLMSNTYSTGSVIVVDGGAIC